MLGTITWSVRAISETTDPVQLWVYLQSSPAEDPVALAVIPLNLKVITFLGLSRNSLLIAGSVFALLAMILLFYHLRRKQNPPLARGG